MKHQHRSISITKELQRYFEAQFNDHFVCISAHLMRDNNLSEFILLHIEHLS